MFFLLLAVARGIARVIHIVCKKKKKGIFLNDFTENAIWQREAGIITSIMVEKK